jgi:hypothetical protein
MGFQEERFLREKLDDAHEVLFSISVRKNEHLATMFDKLKCIEHIELQSFACSHLSNVFQTSAKD